METQHKNFREKYFLAQTDLFSFAVLRERLIKNQAASFSSALFADLEKNRDGSCFLRSPGVRSFQKGKVETFLFLFDRFPENQPVRYFFRVVVMGDGGESSCRVVRV